MYVRNKILCMTVGIQNIYQCDHTCDPFSRRIAKSTFEMTIFQLQPLLK